ncbi:MAG: helix-turn-helix transcriptional regulator, partial [Defluviitaleaceae bacterium]|nr:helix-turn-helix transcriptional regulator [Defluviitaleaceae bacterium]
MFDSHIAILMDILKDKDEFLGFRASVLIRKGTFYNDSALVNEGFKILKDAREEESYKMMKFECLEYQTYVNIDIIKDKLDTTIGENIRNQRIAYRLTQEELAHVLDINPKYISHIECGRRGLTTNHLIKIAWIFGVPIEVLTGLELAELKNFEDLQIKKMLLHYNKLTESEKDFVMEMIKYMPKINQHREDTPLEINRSDD